jgi:molybdopterin molybdotransferase
MIDYSEALEKVLAQSRPCKLQTVQLEKALEYVLAEDVHAKSELPCFDSSAVDGYAVLASDCIFASEEPVTLKLVGTASAGALSKNKVKSGNAIRILTGAVIPSGTDAVVMQEDTVLIGDQVLIKQSAETGQHIRKSGDEFSKGERIISKGSLITPSVIALLATIGYKKVKVFAKPRVALLVTGDELYSSGKKLPKGGVYDSNTPALDAALRSIGIIPVWKARQKDNPVSIRKSISEALKKTDVILTTGGISVGDRDYVRNILSDIGVKTIYWSVAIKPGKPNYFGVYKNKLVFGLPGNPVSGLVSFLLLVRPALMKMMGIKDFHEIKIRAILGSPIKKKPGRIEFVRGTLRTDVKGNIIAEPLKGQDSHMIGNLAQADCLIQLPKQITGLAKGDSVSVSLLRWSLV